MQVLPTSPTRFVPTATAPSSTRERSAGESGRLQTASAQADSGARARSPQAPPEPAPDPLQDPAIQRLLAELSARDSEVRAHEQAHVAAGGALITSGPSYTYQTGPDRRRYAVGGEVGIDTSPVRGDPEATLDKAARIVAAALAPAQPSAQDYRVAGQAQQMAGQARVEIALTRAREAYTSNGPASLQAALTLSIRV
jgi:hypothetical protein